LPGQAFEDIRFEFPGFQLGRVAARRGRNVGGETLPVPKPLQDPGTLSAALFDFVEVAEQVPLELEAVFRCLSQAAAATDPMRLD